MQTRIYFLDNLRTFLIFLVVVIHSGLVYESALEYMWIVVDPVKNDSIGLLRMYLDLFVMATIFFISGYFIPTSVKSKDTWDFIWNKFKRLIIPWFIAVITLIPAYKIIFLYSRGMPQEEWYSYFHFFQRVGGHPGFFADNPVQNWLWFLPVLFLFQIIYLGLSKASWLRMKISLKTAVILTFILGLVYGLIISSTGLWGWYHSVLLHFQNERLLIYFIFFLLGALSYKLKVFETSEKNKKIFLLSNVLLTISLSVYTVVALNLFFNLIEPGRNQFFVSEFIDRIFYYGSSMLSMLCFLYVLIYIFRFKFNKVNSWMSQLNRSSYSLYIIHLVVMGVLALVLLKINIPALAKYLILIFLTFLVSNLLIYVYQKLFQKSIPLKVLAALLILIAFFGVTNSGSTNIVIIKEDQSLTTNPPLTGLHEAVLKDDINSVNQHIAYGSDLNVAEPTAGSSPLITASTFGKTELAIALIKGGANVNFKNNEGSTALHSASFFCHVEIVEALLINGADKTIRNKAGSTALESVSVPFEDVEGIYDYFGAAFGPLGLVLDKEHIKKTRSQIVELLRN